MSTAATALARRSARHREMLAVAVIIIASAFLLQVRPDDRVAPRMWIEAPLPPTCLSHEWFGVRCPGCGLTRSFVDLAHGDWSASWAHHRLGWLLALAVLLQIPYRTVALRRPDRRWLGAWFPSLFGYFLVAALVGNWVLLMLGW